VQEVELLGLVLFAAVAVASVLLAAIAALAALLVALGHAARRDSASDKHQ